MRIYAVVFLNAAVAASSRAVVPQPGLGRIPARPRCVMAATYDAVQLAMMEEQCIVVDFDDVVVGEDTKKNVHLIDQVCMRPGGLPHRAFSVFLFDENWELLVQKRCQDKILFAEHWANTCCSHPLADGATFLGRPIHGEADGAQGTIRAARRKLEQELGIVAEALPASAFHVVTRVHYKAPLPGVDPAWGEHEIDYILLAQRPRALIEQSLNPNPNEVMEVRWLDQQECVEFVEGAAEASQKGDDAELVSPWFGTIARELLHPWWSALKHSKVTGQSISEVVPSDGLIHRLEGAREAMEVPP